MKDLFELILGVLASLFKSRAKLEAEILILRTDQCASPAGTETTAVCTKNLNADVLMMQSAKPCM